MVISFTTLYEMVIRDTFRFCLDLDEEPDLGTLNWLNRDIPNYFLRCLRIFERCIPQPSSEAWSLAQISLLGVSPWT